MFGGSTDLRMNGPALWPSNLRIISCAIWRRRTRRRVGYNVSVLVQGLGGRCAACRNPVKHSPRCAGLCGGGGLIAGCRVRHVGGMPGIRMMVDTEAALSEGGRQLRSRYFFQPIMQPGEMKRTNLQARLLLADPYVAEGRLFPIRTAWRGSVFIAV